MAEGKVGPDSQLPLLPPYLPLHNPTQTPHQTYQSRAPHADSQGRVGYILPPPPIHLIHKFNECLLENQKLKKWPAHDRLQSKPDFWRNSPCEKWVFLGAHLDVSPNFENGYNLQRTLRNGKAPAELLAEYRDQGAIQPAPRHLLKNVSPCFTREKSDGGDRLIVDLKNLNGFLPDTIHFKTQGIQQTVELLSTGLFSWAAKIDIADAYLHIPITQKFGEKLIVMDSHDKLWQWRSLPFGLSHAPRIFCHTLQFALRKVREFVTLNDFYDDILILANSEAQCWENFTKVLQCLTDAGFLAKESKLVYPTQQVEHLGWDLDLQKLHVFPSRKRLEKVAKTLTTATSWRRAPPRALARVLGQLVSLTPFAQGLLTLIQPLCSEAAGLARKMPWSRWTEIPATCGSILRQVQSLLVVVGPFYITTPQQSALVVESDASLDGWGAILEILPYRDAIDPQLLGRERGSDNQSRTAVDERLWDMWDQQERKLHITQLEARGARLGIEAHLSRAKGHYKSLVLRTDSSSLAAAIARERSHSAKIRTEISQIFENARAAGVTVSAIHVPGVQNRADGLSRLPRERQAYSIARYIAKGLIERYMPTTDAFASSWNHILPEWWSWRHHPGASAVDAFAQKWKIPGKLLYINPPWTLINKVLRKLIREQAEAVIVVPDWPGVPYRRLLMSGWVEMERLEPHRGMFWTNTQPMPAPRWGLLCGLWSGSKCARTD